MLKFMQLEGVTELGFWREETFRLHQNNFGMTNQGTLTEGEGSVQFTIFIKIAWIVKKENYFFQY